MVLLRARELWPEVVKSIIGLLPLRPELEAALDEVEPLERVELLRDEEPLAVLREEFARARFGFLEVPDES